MPSPDTEDTPMADAPASTSISAAAHQYQAAMSQQGPAEGAATSTEPTGPTFDSSAEALPNGSMLERINVFTTSPVII
jgi:hypothetical protein